MRKLLVAALLLGSLILACETKTPLGPSSVTPTTSTTTSSTPTTSPTSSTSTSTTTSIPVITSLVRNFKAFPPGPANVPSEMTLFYQLITPQPIAAASSEGATVDPPRENEYRITGVFVMPNGTTGTVLGELGGNANPVELGGEFEGSMTAKTPSGCTAEREFGGDLTPASLTWAGVGPGTSTCSPSPLSFISFTLQRNDSGAPLPTPPAPPTTSSTSTTSSITSTTTTVACTFSLSPTSASIGAAGGRQTVTVNTAPGCAWTAVSFVDWITIETPSGSGTSTVAYAVAMNTSASPRPGNLTIAGIQFVVTQQGGTVDLDIDPDVPTCSPPPVGTQGLYTVTIRVHNIGTVTAPASVTAFQFGNPPLFPGDVRVSTPALGPGGAATHTRDVPDACWQFVPDSNEQRCIVNVRADADGTVPELDDSRNNVGTGTCSRFIVEGVPRLDTIAPASNASRAPLR